jgi:uncharacterized protein (DUF433 family)
MSDEEPLNRIMVDPKVMVGKPVIRGTRLTVELVLNLLAHGATVEELLDDHPKICREDVRACVLYAARHLDS